MYMKTNIMQNHATDQDSLWIDNWHVWKDVEQSCGQSDVHVSAIYIVYNAFTKRCSLQFNNIDFL